MTQKLDPWLVGAFHAAALFLRDRVQQDGWKQFSSNFLREFVRCRYGYKFSNSLSPLLLDEVKRLDPALARWIVTNEHANVVTDTTPRTQEDGYLL